MPHDIHDLVSSYNNKAFRLQKKAGIFLWMTVAILFLGIALFVLAGYITRLERPDYGIDKLMDNTYSIGSLLGLQPSKEQIEMQKFIFEKKLKLLETENQSLNFFSTLLTRLGSIVILIFPCSTTYALLLVQH